MTILRPASIALLITLLIACDKSTTAASREVAALPTDQAKSVPANRTAAAPAAPAQPATQPGVNPQGAATLEFQKRIQDYLKIHNDAEAKVPNLKKTDDPKEISERETALGKMIMTLRAGARPGD